MNGMFGVASTLGEGTVFMCAIPMIVAKAGVELNIAADSTSPSLSNSIEEKDIHKWAESMFIIVDDSTINLRLTKRKLQLGLGDKSTIMTAEDGFVCISMYQELIDTGKQPLLNGIFTDYHMPRCSGLEAIKEIREIESNHPDLKPVYIAVLTGDLTDNARRELMDAGANEVLPKPPAAGQLESICMRLVAAKI